MRGVSAEGYAVAEERVEAIAAAGDAGQLGSELFAVSDVLGREASLRRAMTDPSASSEAKAGLVRTVFEDKLSADTVEAVASAAGARWSSAGDFCDALEQLGALALVIQAEKDGHLSDLEDELFRFGRVVVGDPALRDAITHRQVPIEHRQALVAELLEGRASTSAVTLAVHAVASRHRSFEVAIEKFQKVAADRQRRLIAVVRTALELTDEERQRLAVALGSQYGRDIHLNVVVDPEVLGGIRVELGDDVIDGTVSARLDEARRRISA